MVDSFELTLASVYVCIFPMTAFLLSLVTSPPLFQHAWVSRGCFLHRFNEDQLTNLVSGKMLWTPFHSSLKYGMRSHSFNRTSDISTCLLFRLLTTLHEYRDPQPRERFNCRELGGLRQRCGCAARRQNVSGFPIISCGSVYMMSVY